MKRCPACNRVENDDTLTFCRADGTVLISDSGSVGAEAGTAKFGSAPVASEIETSVLPQNITNAGISRPTAPTTVLPAPRISDNTQELSKPKRRRAIVAIAVVIAGALAVSAYFYLSRKNNVAIQSVAVLPFTNQSGNSDVEYLSDGITESLINSLSQLPNLSVKARSTVFRYKGKDVTPQQVGSELSVQAVLNGRVVLRGDQLTLSLELVDARTGNQIWGEQYNRKTADLVSLQSEIARDVSNELRIKLSGADEQKLAKEYTANPEAYQLYLKGNYFAAKSTKDGLQKGIEYFNHAIAIDPNYALAYNGLALYYIAENDWYLSPHEAMPKAREAARKGLAIDDTLAGAHASLAVVSDWYDWDWATAAREYRRAIELNANDPRPHEFYAWYLAERGRVDEAIAEAIRAQQLDPISPEANVFLGQVLVSFIITIKRLHNCTIPSNWIPRIGWRTIFWAERMNRRVDCRKQSWSFNARFSSKTPFLRIGPCWDMLTRCPVRKLRRRRSSMS
jgi:TolB-like protein/Tfp pilus assembly protein PilF